jgi:hypothetical protein
MAFTEICANFNEIMEGNTSFKKISFAYGNLWFLVSCVGAIPVTKDI